MCVGIVGCKVKREDLASPLYGGNKVRALQFQLGVYEARLSALLADNNSRSRSVHNDNQIQNGSQNNNNNNNDYDDNNNDDDEDVVEDVLPLGVLGSGGSNQVIATVSHMERSMRIRHAGVHALYLSSNLPSLDSSLNMLSTLSFRLASVTSWGHNPLTNLKRLLHVARHGVLLPPGGNNPVGVIGQAR